MAKKILVCQHVPYELLGTLNPLFKKEGFRIKYVNFGRHPNAEPTLDDYDGLILLGGPMNVDEVEKHPHLAHEVKLVKDAIKKDIPVLGICLGAQLIAQALGASVKPNSEKEIGWYDFSLTEDGKNDPIFKHFNNNEEIFQWHGYTFDIPDGAKHLASSSTCTNQAFSYGDKVYAMQFHLEVDEPLINRWLKVPLHVEEINSLNGKVVIETIQKETHKNIDNTLALSESVFSEFIKLFGKIKKSRQLCSK